MNVMGVLYSLPWMERLGWTLLHFVWQGLLLAGLYAAARRAMTRSGPDARYLAACLTLVAMLGAPIATFLYLAPAADPIPPTDATARILPFSPQPIGAVVVLTPFAPVEASGAWMRQAAPWIVAIWLSGALVFWLRLAGGWWVTARIRSRQIRPAPPEWLQTLTHLCDRIRLSRPVRLLVSTRVDVPMVVGWTKPVVLVPLGALSGLPADQVEALLLHELAHIARHDYLLNVLQGIAEALLFYHPTVWWISAQIRAERELCCDDLAVSAAGDAFTYATALAGLEAYRPIHARSALASNGGRLAERIARVLGRPVPEPLTFSMPAAATGAALLAVVGVMFAQTPERPKFEVASVKPTQDNMRSSAGMRPLPGGRLHAENMPTRTLMMRAYHLQDFQIAGAPAWLSDEGFDIEAKGAPNATNAQIMLMLQSLLEDRFGLKYHRETRELPVYALTVMRGGARLPAPKEGGCMKPDGTTPPNPAGPAPLPPCGRLYYQGANPGMRTSGGDLSMPEFVQHLAEVLGRPVLDRTGITTHFDVRLVYSTDEMTAGLMASWGTVAGHRESVAAAAASGNPGDPPNIQIALREQLGLKLESAKGPVEVLVIDRVERPSGN